MAYKALLSGLICAANLFAFAKTINVPEDGDIQFAITNVVSGDHIVIAASTEPYIITKAITVPSGVTLRGTSGDRNDVVISGNKAVAGMTLSSGSVVSNLTLTSCVSAGGTAGVTTPKDAKMENCRITSCYSTARGSWGVAVKIDGTLKKSCIDGNYLASDLDGHRGIAVYANAATVLMEDVIITNNWCSLMSANDGYWYGGAGIRASGGTYRRCYFGGNSLGVIKVGVGTVGSGFYATAAVTLENCTIEGNLYDGAEVDTIPGCYLSHTSSKMKNTILFNNRHVDGYVNNAVLNGSDSNYSNNASDGIKSTYAAKVKIEGCMDQVGPTKYYNDLVAKYLKELETEKTNIENFYKAKTAVANKEALEKAINAIIAKAELIKKDAPDNEKAYNGDGAQMKGQKYDVTVSLQDYYNKISFEIKSSDESNKLEYWTAELDAIQSKINKLAADVDSYYNNGQSVAKNQDVANAITSIKKELDNLLASQKDGYNQQIADDNAARYKNFTDALKSAQTAFEEAVKTQNTYSSVTNPELKEKIEAGTETLIKNLYEYPVKLADLAKKTADEFGKVTSPALYDETDEVATAKQYADEIKGIQDKLTDAALKNVSFTIYENKVNSAVAALNAKADIQKFYTVKEGDKDVVKTAAQLKDVQDIIDAGKKALEEKKIAGVDGALNALADINNMIAADQHKAANAQLSDRVQKLKDAIEDHLEFLAGLEGQEDLIKNYKKAVDEKFAVAEEALVEAQAAGECFVGYDALDAKIDAFESDYYVGKAKTMFETANNLPAAQKLLDEAIAEVSQYHVAPDYAKTWDNFQNTLDRAKADPSVNISGLTSKWTGIPAKRTEAYNAEYDYLKTVAPVELQDQYNQLVADRFAGMENETTAALKKEIEDAGLKLIGIESVNIHDAIKVGTPDREQYIENYITTLERLGQADIHMVCYNFMPVFDWTRSELARVRPDGSTVLAYNQEAIDAINPEKMFESIAGDMNGTVMPGWEPERMARVKELFEMYKDVDDEKLFENLKYFLERILVGKLSDTFASGKTAVIVAFRANTVICLPIGLGNETFAFRTHVPQCLCRRNLRLFGLLFKPCHISFPF